MPARRSPLLAVALAALISGRCSRIPAPDGAGTRTPSRAAALSIWQDAYGGLRVRVAAPGNSFRVKKVGGRWVLVTPAGNAFWMLAVYAITGDAHIDELGSSYNVRLQAKYGSDQAGWPQANRRLATWGFNTIGPYSHRMTWPTTRDSAWPGGEQPVKMPIAGIAYHPAARAVSTGACRNLYAGLDPAVLSLGRNFPDVYDAAYAAFLNDHYLTDWAVVEWLKSSYTVGMFSDDTDDIYGFGPGTDFPTDPTGKASTHLGVIALLTAPAQSGKTVYTKLVLRDWLASKYGTIAALNAAWGSSYTTFDANGGWPGGSGLLDENGRASHTWLGSPVNATYLTGMRPQVKADLDEFLYQLAGQYFRVNRAALKAAAPSVLFFGPTNVGGWRAPARGPILKAAGRYADVINTGGSDFSQTQLDFIATWAGDVPLAIWDGMTANPDSGRWRYSMAPASWVLRSQEERGMKYQGDVEALVNMVATPTGSRPYVGLTFWAWMDLWREQANWGLVSLLDNAYDGKEARIAAGTDEWGFATGGEELDYGDFLSYVTTANLNVQAQLAAELISELGAPAVRTSQWGRMPIPRRSR